MNRVATFFALVCLGAIVEAQDAGLPIIDMHMHVSGPTPAPAYRPCYPRPCQGPARQTHSTEEFFQLSVKLMQEHNVVLGFLGHTSATSLDHVFDWAERAPGLFLPAFKVCDPRQEDLVRAEREIQAGRIKAIGEVSSQYCGIALDDPVLDPVFALADKYDLPVMVHAHGTGGPGASFRIDIGRPTTIEDVVVKYPNLRVSMEDAGFPFLEDMIAIMYRYPNVYGDLSNISWLPPRKMFYRYLQSLMDAGLGKRLMFGSDQMQWPEVIPLAVEAIESAPFLSAEEKRDIFYNNAARFLRLSEEEIAAHHGPQGR